MRSCQSPTQGEHFLAAMHPLISSGLPLTAGNFTPHDVENLFGVLSNRSLVVELRRSAAEQLLTLATDGTLLSAIATPDYVRQLVKQCVPELPSPSRSTDLSTAMSMLDMQLPSASLNLLYILAVRSRSVRQWLLASPAARIMPLLPLAFHTLTSVRAAACKLLAALVVLPAAEHCRAYPKLFADALEAGAALPLPDLFCSSLLLPFHVRPVSLASGGTGAAEGATPDQDMGLLKQLVGQQRLFAAANGDADAALQLLDQDLTDTRMSQVRATGPVAWAKRRIAMLAGPSYRSETATNSLTQINVLLSQALTMRDDSNMHDNRMESL